jgi:DNA-directed RNA polymerase subunit E'/Rpb7
VQLYRQVEGTCSGRHGYIVAIISVDGIGSGMVHDSYGFVSFDVKYTAIVLKPFKNEVFDAMVESVNKVRGHRIDIYSSYQHYRWDSLLMLDLYKSLFPTT